MDRCAVPLYYCLYVLIFLAHRASACIHRCMYIYIPIQYDGGDKHHHTTIIAAILLLRFPRGSTREGVA